jgi:ribonuclease HI
LSQQRQCVFIETDTRVIMKALSKKNFRCTNWGNVIRNYSRDLEGLSHVSVTWVNRKSNQAAHKLARLAISKPNMFWFNNFSACILSHVLSDMEGVT